MGSRASTRPLDLFESEGNMTEFEEAANLEDLLDQSDAMSISSNTINNNVWGCK